MFNMKRPMFILLSLVCSVLIIFLALIFINSSSQPKPFLDKDGQKLSGSISEKVFVEINGQKQGMFIKGKSLKNPILLYVHGGMPDFFLTQQFPTGLENYFTVVWWEQRGVGISYSDSMDLKTLDSQQLIEDTKTLSQYLCRRFNCPKIYLMGHSGGTFIALQAAAQAPQLYAAYIGVAQMVNQRASEQEAYKYMLQTFQNQGDSEMVCKFRKTSVPNAGDLPKAYLSLRDEAMHRLGVGTMRRMNSVISGLFIPSLFFKEYSFTDKLNLWRAKANSGVSVIWNEMLNTDLSKKVSRLEVPFYVFHGTMDYTVSYTLSKEYLKHVEAPVKGFYSFCESAHSPMFEEPQKMAEIIQHDVLKSKTSLSDKLE